jgi:hypothetical protein
MTGTQGSGEEFPEMRLAERSTTRSELDAILKVRGLLKGFYAG